MTNNVIQSSFSSGEIAPSMFGRVDLTTYHKSLALMSNWFVDVRGGASTRPGTSFIGQANISDVPVRLIPFRFSTTQDYVLEFGNEYMRVIVNGAYVLESPVTISGISNSNPAVVSAVGHGYSNSDTVTIQNVSGMTQVNGISYLVAGATTNTFTLEDLNGVAIDSTTYGVYSGGGTVSRVYTLATPYLAIDLALLKYSQSADVMTLTHISYAPADLNRMADDDWSLTDIMFTPSIDQPVIVSVTPSSIGTTQYSYIVTAISASTKEEGIGSIAVTNALCAPMSTTSGAFNTVVWDVVAGAIQYNVYRQMEVIGSAPSVSSLYGFIGTSVVAQGSGPTFSFVDQNISPDFTQVPPYIQEPFAGGNNPGCSCYFQQRKVFAGSSDFPQTFWMTQPGAYTNMNISVISRATDAITATLSAAEVNAIEWAIPFSSLVMLTNAGAWQVTGGSGPGSPITPSTIDALPQAYNGSSNYVRPLTINYDILYVPYLGSGVFDLAYNFILQTFYGDDISVLSSHLFYNYTIQDWCYQEVPLKIIWMVRNDGALLSLTYMKTQDLQGYAQHFTNGFYRSVCSVVEGNMNAVYAVVERLSPEGGYVKYIERFENRIYASADPSLPWCVDAGLSYPWTPGTVLLTPSGTDGTITLMARSSFWTSGNIGDAVRLNGGKAIITGYTSATLVTANVVWPLTSIYPAASGEWEYNTPTQAVSGLQHLNGLQVTGLADGGVIPLVTVVNGAITLPAPCSDIIVGLPYVCQMKTLPLDTGEPTIQGKRKKIAAVTMRVVNSRGLSIGTTLDTLTNVVELTPDDVLGSPIPLQNTDQRVVMDPLWQEAGQFYVEQSNPLPATITALIPEIVLGDNYP